jgi:excisionase family DNA binding protein
MSTAVKPPPTPALHDGRSTVHTSKLLTPDDLAARWQVKTSQVYRLTREGRLPTVKIGRYYRYRLADAEQWEQKGGAGL